MHLQSAYIKSGWNTAPVKQRVKGLVSTASSRSKYKRNQVVHIGGDIQNNLTVSGIHWNAKGKVVGHVVLGEAKIPVVKIGEALHPHTKKKQGLWSKIG